MPVGNSGKACWPCRDKKIRCDKRLPKCNRCSQLERKCVRDGMRLSWPKPGNSSRARIGVVSPNSLCDSLYIRGEWFLNVTVTDILLLENIDTIIYGHSISYIPLIQTIPSIQFSIAEFSSPENSLLAYCTHLSTRLERHNHYQLLLKMSLSDDSLASTAVLQAMLALSSLHLHRFAEGYAHRARALSALISSAKELHKCKETLQHIAAHMLLCLFEMNNAACFSSQWQSHACCAKMLLGMADKDGEEYATEMSILFNWVYYHEVIAKFSRSYWAGIDPIQNWPFKDIYLSRPKNMTSSSSKQTTYASPGCSMEMLNVIGGVCDLVTPFRDRREGQLNGHPQDLQPLILYLEETQQFLNVTNFQVSIQGEETEKLTELYRLAILIYLLRTATAVQISSHDISKYIDLAFTILEGLDTCEREFPLLIIACEARCDNRRRMVLDLLWRTQSLHYSGIILSVERIVKAAWAQDDLNLDESVDYCLKLTAVVSSDISLSMFS